MTAAPNSPHLQAAKTKAQLLIAIAVGVFSGISLAIALALGAVLSWSLIRPMRTVDQWLDEYGASHQNAANKVLHWICVPVIVVSILPSAENATA